MKFLKRCLISLMLHAFTLTVAASTTLASDGQTKSGGSLTKGIAIAVVGVLVTLLIYWMATRNNCKKCSKGKYREVSRQEVGTERISIQKTETIKHFSKEQTSFGQPKPGASSHPESVSTRKYSVPGVRTHIEITLVCNQCGDTITRRTFVDTEV